jgi:anaerobic magnesium-protoporphyrin IX monomethyl ester cyclase
VKTKFIDLVLIRPAFTEAIYSGVYKTKYKVGLKKVDPPMQLMLLASAVKFAGLSVKIIDAEVNNLSTAQILEEVIKLNPLYVGITSTTPEMHNAINIIKSIKDILPNTITIFGGAHATHVPWEIIDKFPNIDFVVVYEGEKALAAICSNNSSKIEEYKNNAEILFETCKVPLSLRSRKILLGECQSTTDLENNIADRQPETISMEHYMATDPDFGLLQSDSIETARGCPYGCSFCSSARSGLAVKSVQNVLDELLLIYEMRKKSNKKILVTFLDDTLTFNRERAAQIFEGMLSKKINVNFRAFTRANTIFTKAGMAEDLEFTKLMMKAGSTALSFGVETGSETINKGLNKGVNLEDYVGAYHILQLAGFRERRGSFIVGHPFETESTIVESIKFAKKIGLNRIGVNIMTPYPGTETYNSAREGKGLYFEKEALDTSNYKRWGHSIVSTPALSSQALVYWQKRFLAEIALSSAGMKFFGLNLIRGNFSAYYHQPTISALKSIGKLYPTPTFEKPDHSNYNPEDFGQNHLTKNDCIRVLNKIYNMSFSKKSINNSLIPNFLDLT